jgi:GGDEF domain-containing protein
MPPEVTSPASANHRQEAALHCYLSAMLAMAKSMRAICSRAGLIYGDRLMKLPRRLAFDPSAAALEESRGILETDLAEYTQATLAWLEEGSSLAREIVTIIAAMEPYTSEGESLHANLLEELAEQMAVSAEVDSSDGLREAMRRYALGLRSYLKQRRLENRSSLKDVQRRGDQLAKWLARADPSHSADRITGLPNRAEFERRLEAGWNNPRPVSVLVFQWKLADSGTADAGPAIAKQIGDRLADLVRPRDVVACWDARQFAVIFECSGAEAAQRAQNVAEWLSGEYSTLVEGAVQRAVAQVHVLVIERLDGEALGLFLDRVEQTLAGESVVNAQS